MHSQIKWMRLDVVMAIHMEQIAVHGGLSGVRDEGLLHSALERPKHKMSYSDPKPSLEELAAAYAFGISGNHPFFDGNKRTAFVFCYTFLRINGKKWVYPSREERVLKMEGLASGALTEIDFGLWLKTQTANI